MGSKGAYSPWNTYQFNSWSALLLRVELTWRSVINTQTRLLKTAKMQKGLITLISVSIILSWCSGFFVFPMDAGGRQIWAIDIFFHQFLSFYNMSGVWMSLGNTAVTRRAWLYLHLPFASPYFSFFIFLPHDTFIWTSKYLLAL